jgi:pimeloyl-ACP methyl ester carboxylesterase
MSPPGAEQPSPSALPARAAAARSAWRRALVKGLAVLLGLALLAGAAFRLRPIAVLEEWGALRLRLQGVESREVLVGRHRIHFLVEGPKGGTPVVLVHGLGARAEAWGPLSRYLVEAGFRVYAPDLLGYGRSDKPSDASYSIAEQADGLVAWFDAVGLTQVDLGGWSMGGWIVQRVAADHPERVRRLMLFDSAGLGIVPDWDVRLFTPQTRDDFVRLQALLSPAPRPIPGFILDDLIRTRAETNWVIDRALASMRAGKDVTDATLPTLKMPVLVLWGGLDHVTPVSEGEAMHRLIPQSELEILDACGHLAPSECAAQAGPRTVRFLQSGAGQSRAAPRGR